MRRFRIRWNKEWPDPRRRTGRWWRSFSPMFTAKQLRRLIDKEEVAVYVLESLEDAEDTGEFVDGVRVVRLRLNFPEDRMGKACLDVSLTDLGLGLIEVDPNQLEQRHE